MRCKEIMVACPLLPSKRNDFFVDAVGSEVNIADPRVSSKLNIDC